MKIKATVVITSESKREWWGDIPLSDEQIAEMALQQYREEPFTLLDGPDQITVQSVEIED